MGGKRHIELIARGVLMRQGKVLLCRSVRGGYFYLPGGHVEFGEKAAAAVRREFKEETGLDIVVGQCVLVTEGHFFAGDREHHEVNLVFLVEHEGDGLDHFSSREPEIAFEWVDLAAIVSFDVRPLAVRAWLAGGGAIDPKNAATWISEISDSCHESEPS